MRSSISGAAVGGDGIVQKPYQVYSELINTGKNIGSTKRRIIWRFGWSNSPATHEVELKHSLVSGKKTVYENGVEIISVAQSMMATDFSHGWNSQACKSHIYRVEAQISMIDDPIYLFMIDGVPFSELPREPVKLPPSETRKSVTSERRASADLDGPVESYTPSSKAVPRLSQSDTTPATTPSKTPSKIPTATVDPFGDDPFGLDTTQAPPAPASAAAALFGSFDSPVNNSAPAATGTFDAFNSPAPAPTLASFDLFAPTAVQGSTPVSSSSTFDPFASSTPPVSTATDPFAASAISTGAISSAAATRRQSIQQAAKPVSSTPAVDLLMHEPVTTAPKSRRMSAQDILLQDLSGLSFGPPPAMKGDMSSFDPFATPVEPPKPAESPAVIVVPPPGDQADLLAEATSKLVSLDLNRKSVGPMVSVQERKLDHEKRLSLNDLQPTAPERRSSMIARPVDPFAATALPPNSFGGGMGGGPIGGMGGPMGGPMGGLGAPMGIHNSSTGGFMGSTMGNSMGGPIGTMGGPMASPMGGMGGPMSGSMGGPIGSMGSTLGGGMNGPKGSLGMSTGGTLGGSTSSNIPSGGAMNLSSTVGSSRYSAQAAPKSSLDTLDWKAY